jgi:tetratricopeptide (TPR) repeat protein
MQAQLEPSKALEDQKRAILSYDAALEIRPQRVWTLNDRGLLKARLGLHREAIQDFTKVIGIKPDWLEGYVIRSRVGGEAPLFCLSKPPKQQRQH